MYDLVLDWITDKAVNRGSREIVGHCTKLMGSDRVTMPPILVAIHRPIVLDMHIRHLQINNFMTNLLYILPSTRFQHSFTLTYKSSTVAFFILQLYFFSTPITYKISVFLLLQLILYNEHSKDIYCTF